MAVWKKAVLSAVVATVGIGFAVQTFAKGGMQGGMHGGGERPAFETFDANADGMITADEIKAVHAAHFAEMDTNGDGSLDRDELLAAAAERARGNAEKQLDRMIAWQDADGDGALSAEEMPGNQMGRMFQRLDADGDGQVSEEEFAKMAEHGGRQGKKGKKAKRGNNAGDDNASDDK